MESGSSTPTPPSKLSKLGFDRPGADTAPSSSKPSTAPLTIDRSLESSFTFDEVTKPLPKPADLLKSKRSKHKQPQQQTDADTRSFAARFDEEKTPPPQPDYCDKFMTRLDSLKPKSTIDAVTKRTWAALYALIAWEVYINSPFFELAAPLSLIVY